MTEQELEPLVDDGRLRVFLADALGPADVFRLKRHRAGHSNETFFLTWGAHDLVLRRPPRGAFLPTAHDVVREYRVLSALEGQKVRTPRTVLACEDESVIGAPFYLMENIRGKVIRLALPETLDHEEDHRRIGEELVDALVELHAVDWEEAGLESIGKPDGYLERQVKRWGGQLELTQPKTREARDVPDLRAVGDWLHDHVPESPAPTLVHGDYKLDNTCFDTDSPARLVGIFDWEMATNGDPFADVGWMLTFWADPADEGHEMADMLHTVTGLPGFLTRTEMLRRYEVRSGRKVPDLSFYLVLAHWKLAILLEGSYARHLAGKTDDPFFEMMREGVPALAKRALQRTERVGS